MTIHPTRSARRSPAPQPRHALRAGSLPRKGRNPEPTGAHHDRSANALRQPATRGSALHEQLVRTLREAILAGHLPLHSRLPASRLLARDLGISRSTVELAYGRLEAEGYLVRKVGAGSFVALAAVRPAPRPPQSAAGLSRRGQEMALGGACHDVPEVGTTFASSQPDPRLFPQALWGRLMQQQWRQRASDWMNYGDPQGLGELRAAISSYLVQSRGVVCEPDQILILTSSQQGILLATQLLIDAGDTVWVEDPGYPGARTAMESAGARVHPVPVDEEGLNPHGVILHRASSTAPRHTSIPLASP